MPPPAVPRFPVTPSVLSNRLKATANWFHQKMTVTKDAIQDQIPGHIPDGYDELVEGTARALYRRGEVFYNPAQVVNRDLSVLVLRYLQRQRGENAPPLHILEALSATGLRAVRYYKEIPNVASVVANDLDPTAVQTIRQNVIHNKLDPIKQIIPNHGNAITVMALASASTNPTDQSDKFHVVDLDPYGSAAPFLDTAVCAVANNGFLAVTCTDLAVLCGNSPEICYGRYAATPLKGPIAHELAVRIVFNAIQAAANRHGRAVEPIVCVKIDFYVRLFVRVLDSRSLAQKTPSLSSLVFQCAECGTHRFQSLGRVRENKNSNTAKKKRKRAQSETKVVQEQKNNTEEKKQQQQVPLKFSAASASEELSPRCSICEGTMVLGGPIWAGPLVEKGVADSIMKEIDEKVGVLNARDRVAAILRVVDEEIRDVPLFLHLPTMCKILRVSSPPAASVRSVLVEKGYKVSQSHTDPQAIKTDAPAELVWDILRVWAKKAGSPILKMLAKEDSEKVNGESEVNGEKGEKRKRRSTGERILAKEVTMVKPEEVDFTKKKDQYVRKGTGEKVAPRFPQNPQPYWGPKARAGKRKRPEEEKLQETKE